MWKLLCVFSLVTLQVVRGKLVGNHICRTEESYTVNVTEHYVRDVTVRNYKWCLNVPPRCSFYIIKKINDTRIAERNKTATVEKCCPGYFESNHHCIPYCDSCQKGICKENICHCSPGYSGLKCDTRCSLGNWGPNCTNACNCISKSCDPVNGDCDTSTSDSNGPHQETDQNDIWATTLKNDPNEPYFISNLTNKLFEYMLTSPTTLQINKEHNNITAETMYSLLNTSTVSPAKDTSTYDASTLKDVSNNEYNVGLETSTMTNSTTEYLDIKEHLVNENGELLIPVKIQYEQNQIAKPFLQENVTKATTTTIEGENYLDENSKTGSSKIAKEYYFINSVSVSAVTTIVILLLAIATALIIFAAKRKHKSKDKLEDTDKVSTAAIYTASIFHTPLPEPPICENPSYLSQMECQNCLNGQTITTQMICMVNACNELKADIKSYEYDYPPSSGSYRAASVVEPLDADTYKKLNSTQSEPIYDEIPCRSSNGSSVEKTPYENQSVSLYMNTCSSTKKNKFL